MRIYKKQNKTNKDTFLIITHPRSGSTNICYILNQHPSISCGGEEVGANLLKEKKIKNTYENKINEVLRFLYNGNSNKITGFKIFPDQIDLKKFESFLNARKDIKLLWLERINNFESCISFLYAVQCQEYESAIFSKCQRFKNIHKWNYLINEKIEYKNIIIDEERFKYRLKEFVKCKNELNSFFSNKYFLKIIYEDGVDKNIEKICNYLKVNKFFNYTQLQKINKNNIYQDVIKNYNSLKKIYNSFF